MRNCGQARHPTRDTQALIYLLLVGRRVRCSPILLKEGASLMRHILLCTLILCLSCLSASGRQGTLPKKQDSKQQILTAEDFLQGRVDRGSGREPVTLLIGINHKLP